MRRQIIIDKKTKIVRAGGRPPKIVTILLSLQIGIFLLYVFADGPKWIDQYLIASATSFIDLFELWQPITALWIHLSLQHLLVNLLTLWILGSSLEHWWGKTRFLVFWVITGVCGLVLGVLIGMATTPNTLLYGSGGSSMAMMVAFAVLFPDHLLFFYGLIPLKGKYFALILVSFVLIANIISGAYLDLAIYGGGVIAALFFLFRINHLIGMLLLNRAKRKFKIIKGQNQKKYLN